MNSKLIFDLLDYLHKRYNKINDTLNSNRIHLYAKKMGKLYPLFNQDLIAEKTLLIRLIEQLKDIEISEK